MAGATGSVEGVLVDFPTTLLSKIGREGTREALININRLISGNTAYMVSNLRGRRHGHLMLTMTHKEYTIQTGYEFVPPHYPDYYPQMMGTSQEKSLGTKGF